MCEAVSELKKKSPTRFFLLPLSFRGAELGPEKRERE